MSTQLVSYDFITIENPLSDGGNFVNPSTYHVVQAPSIHFADAPILSTSCAAIYTGISWPNDQYSEVTVGIHGSGSDTLAIWLRVNASGTAAYSVNILGPSGSPVTPTVYLFQPGPTFTVLKTGSATTFNNGDVIRFSVSGSNLSVYQNGVLVPSLSVSNSVVTSGSPGFEFFTTTSIGNNGITLWAGGNSAAVTATQVGAFLVGF